MYNWKYICKLILKGKENFIIIKILLSGENYLIKALNNNTSKNFSFEKRIYTLIYKYIENLLKKFLKDIFLI